jgi:TolB-like protein
MSMTIYIDGKYSGSIPAGGIAEFELSNGQHSIYIASLSTTRSNLLTIKVDNDKHFFKAIADSYIRYILIEESVESIGITDYSLLDTAINNTFNTISQNIPQNARIAIVNISSVNNNDQPEANFIMEELSVLMVNSKKFTVVDRQTLDTIRMEQNFQMTGEVGDDSAISIGKFLGANVVITGSIAGAGNQRRLRLKALDVLTAQVLAMSSYGI